MKIQESETKRSNNTVIKGLYALGGTWVAVFVPVVMIIIGLIIPFGDAQTRSYILKLVSSEPGKIFLLLMICLPIWCALQQILTILHQFNIHPKREKLLTFGLALAWTIHALFILFVRT